MSFFRLSAARRKAETAAAISADLSAQVKRADNLAQAPAYRSRLSQIDGVMALMESLLAQDACFSLRQLAVNGRDMMDLGLRGPDIGAMLRYLLEQVLDGAVPNEHAALLALAEKKLSAEEG